MSYLVLARKWRPKTFAEVIGQNHVTQALSNALLQQRLHHAYLFTGTRGVGKTTLARILAKCLNCELGMTPNPCGQCKHCVEIDSGRSLDLFEVDAASRTKVEDTRDLLENVQYAPASARFKIYLIDEVHMLSGHSFNALLKTLEEPPEHVKFLFATTDPQKLPITILSRTLQFNLKMISELLLAQHLTHVLEKEAITFTKPAVEALARAAQGSARDALSLLDQAIGYCQADLTEDKIQHMLGFIEDHYIENILNALATTNAEHLLQACHELAASGGDYLQALEQVLTTLHQIACQQTLPSLAPSNKAILSFAKTISPELIQLFYQIGLHGRRDIPLAPTPKIGFEMAMLRMLAFTPATATEKKNLNKRDTVMKKVAPPPIEDNQSHWQNLCATLPFNGLQKVIAENCILREITDQHYHLLIEPTQHVLVNANLVKSISECLSQHTQKPLTVTIEPGTNDMMTPQVINAKQHLANLEIAKHALQQDPMAAAIQNKFNATLQEDSIDYAEG